MPTIWIDGYQFRFYASDFNEPPHMHVLKDDKMLKVWLAPVKVAVNHGYTGREARRIARLTQQHQAELQRRWDEYFNR